MEAETQADDDAQNTNNDDTLPVSPLPERLVSTAGTSEWGSGDGGFSDDTRDEVLGIVSDAHGVLDDETRLDWRSEGYMATARMTLFTDWSSADDAAERLSDLPDDLEDVEGVSDVEVSVQASAAAAFAAIQSEIDGFNSPAEAVETIARDAESSETYSAAIRLMDEDTRDEYTDALDEVFGGQPLGGHSHLYSTGDIPADLWACPVVQVRFDVDADREVFA